MVGRSDIFVLRGGVVWDRRVVGRKELDVWKRGGMEMGRSWRRVLVERVWSIHLSSRAARI